MSKVRSGSSSSHRSMRPNGPSPTPHTTMDSGYLLASTMAASVSPASFTCPSATMSRMVYSRVLCTSAMAARMSGAKVVGPNSVSVGTTAAYRASTSSNPTAGVRPSASKPLSVDRASPKPYTGMRPSSSNAASVRPMMLMTAWYGLGVPRVVSCRHAPPKLRAPVHVLLRVKSMPTISCDASSPAVRSAAVTSSSVSYRSRMVANVEALAPAAPPLLPSRQQQLQALQLAQQRRQRAQQQHWAQQLIIPYTAATTTTTTTTFSMVALLLCQNGGKYLLIGGLALAAGGCTGTTAMTCQ